jgi:hypothetical protein
MMMRRVRRRRSGRGRMDFFHGRGRSFSWLQLEILFGNLIHPFSRFYIRKVCCDLFRIRSP